MATKMLAVGGLALEAIEEELRSANDCIAQIVKLPPEQTINSVREDGHIAQVDIHIQKATEWLEAMKELRKWEQV